MFYSLVLLITINGHADAFVIDRNLTLGDCFDAMRNAKHGELYRAPHTRASASFSCDRTTKGAR